MQHLQPNTTLLGGKYRIEKVLGQGGFGITYLATQVSLNRLVAIKEFFMKDFCIRGDNTRTIEIPTTGSAFQVEQYKRKFWKETKNLFKMSHPNIIKVFEVFEENDTVYYVMPYLSGGSLQEYVNVHGAMSEGEAMKYIRQIASALKYMHEKKHICHYDVKPANILLDENKNAILIDFGISKNYDAAGQETSTTPIGMSEGYAPIEQYQKIDEFSPVSDVYALGATLYFLLHGKPPVNAAYRASGTILLMNKYLSQDIKDVINMSMKISKRERAKSVDVFLGNINTSSQRVACSGKDEENESTIIKGSHREEVDSSPYGQPNSYQDVTSTIHNSSSSAIGWIIGIAVVAIIGVFLFLSRGESNNTGDIDFSNINVEDTIVTPIKHEDSPTDIYKDRVKQFAKKQGGVIASYPDDNRYSVYYSQKDEYGRNFLYHYDAIADKSEKMNLPIAATVGDYTDLWLTKNRYIFVAAEYRYTDFIRIDTQTNQVKYITECASVKRTSSGFTAVQSECINEYSATCEADKVYAYTDYNYNEEGINVGHGQQYR